jgi:hypothetical protein
VADFSTSTGRVKVVVRRAPATECTLTLRILEWCASWNVRTDGEHEIDGGWLRPSPDIRSAVPAPTGGKSQM